MNIEDLEGLAYLVVDDHDPRYPVGDGSQARIDAARKAARAPRYCGRVPGGVGPANVKTWM